MKTIEDRLDTFSRLLVKENESCKKRTAEPEQSGLERIVSEVF